MVPLWRSWGLLQPRAMGQLGLAHRSPPVSKNLIYVYDPCSITLAEFGLAAVSGMISVADKAKRVDFDL